MSVRGGSPDEKWGVQYYTVRLGIRASPQYSNEGSRFRRVTN